MPNVDASYLMTKYDNERVQVVPDPWSDRLCPISDASRIVSCQLTSSYWILTLSVCVLQATIEADIL